MYIQLIDRSGFRSAVLYIHCDEDEFLNRIYKWRNELLDWIEETPFADGLPLGRLDPDTAMVDLMRELTMWEVDMQKRFKLRYAGRIVSTLRLLNYHPNYKIKRILLVKEDSSGRFFEAGKFLKW